MIIVIVTWLSILDKYKYKYKIYKNYIIGRLNINDSISIITTINLII